MIEYSETVFTSTSTSVVIVIVDYLTKLAKKTATRLYGLNASYTML